MKNSTLKKEQVRENILFRILSGQYPLEGRVPPERELCGIMNVSRITIRAAVDDLVREGILQRDGRRGTLIKKIPRTVSSKKRKRILFIYFSSIKGHLIDQSGASARLYHGIEHFANEHGHALMVQSGENFLCQSAKYHNSIDGIIAGGSQLEKHFSGLAAFNVPMIAADVIPHGLNIDAVCGDDYEAGVRAAQRVVGRGCGKPLFLLLKYEDENFLQPCFVTRMRGFFDTLGCGKNKELKLIINHTDLAGGGPSLAAVQALVKKEKVDCLVHCADTATYLQLRGIRGLAGLPAIIIAVQTEALPSGKNVDLIVSDLERIGYLAAERLHERLRNPCLEIIRYLVPVKIKTE